jgi:hypothetical protein
MVHNRWELTVKLLMIKIHIAPERGTHAPYPTSSRHPCFTLESADLLLELQQRIWDHHKEGSPSAALECDEPGKADSGSKVSTLCPRASVLTSEQGVEYPTRFFARDFAGNRLEFAAFPTK